MCIALIVTITRVMRGAVTLVNKRLICLANLTLAEYNLYKQSSNVHVLLHYQF